MHTIRTKYIFDLYQSHRRWALRPATALYKLCEHMVILCCMKGEKVSTPLDKDGRGPSDLQHTYG